MELAVATGEGLDAGPFLQVDAKDFYCIGSVLRLIDSSDRCLPALDEEAENLLCFPRYLLPPLHLMRHRPNTRHPGLLAWVQRDAPFEYVLSWWFFGRS